MKGSILAASVALAGSAAAYQHKGHAALHMKRGDYKKEEVCTVYTTVYVHTMPSMVANSTAYVVPAHAPSTSCSEEAIKTPIYTPIVISTPAAAPTPSKPAEVYPPAPPKPETSKPAEYPPAPPTPEASKPAEYPPAPPKPETSTSCTEEESKPSKPAEVYPPAPHKPEETKPAETYPAPPTPEASKPAATYPAAPPAEPSKPAQVYPPAPKPEKPTSSKAADKPKPTGGYSSGDRIVTNGNKWAMTYTPYAKDGQCKTSTEIASDIKHISEMGFTTIRSYSTDCGVFEFVVPECEKYGLKVIYGIFLEGGGAGGKGPFSNYANEQLEAIKSNAPKAGVAMVIVGNECIFNGNCDAPTLGSYIDHVRETLQGAGFPKDIAITTTEPVGTWEEHGAALCDHIDIFTCQVHPYFTSSVTAEMAGDFAISQLAQAAKVCPEAAKKGTYITEIGWPSAGNSNGAAVASPESQKIAIQKIQEAVGDEACIFSYQNDTWKAPGSLNVEQYFGCGDIIA